jgi:hypothetical protein
MTGKMPAEGINPVEFPEILDQLWLWFLDLNSSRSGGMGPGPITYPDMQAYFRLMRIDPEPWQVGVIKRMDGIALESMRD